MSKAITNYMIHGPYETSKFNSPCMKECICSKFHPKKITHSTTIDEDEYPCYK